MGRPSLDDELQVLFPGRPDLPVRLWKPCARNAGNSRPRRALAIGEISFGLGGGRRLGTGLAHRCPGQLSRCASGPLNRIGPVNRCVWRRALWKSVNPGVYAADVLSERHFNQRGYADTLMPGGGQYVREEAPRYSGGDGVKMSTGHSAILSLLSASFYIGMVSRCVDIYRMFQGRGELACVALCSD